MNDKQHVMNNTAFELGMISNKPLGLNNYNAKDG